MLNRIFAILIATFISTGASAQQMRLGLLKYGGGGDWYANPTALKNLANFCNENIKTNFSNKEMEIEPSSNQIFNYPFIHATGHGRLFFTNAEAANLRLYLESGGFIHFDDNYGLDEYIRPELKKVFPELSLVELPFSHPVFNGPFKFQNGLPKIHEHEGKAPQAFGLIWKGRLVCLYTFSTDLGDGWEDQEVHKNSPEKRLQALQMGANIVYFVFNKNAKP